MDAAPDIFLSYSREDQPLARRIAAALQAEGWRVWWDQALNAGDAYDRITEQALESAKAVVVLWSRASVESRWVRAEATTADRRGTFVPVMIEPCKRPIMFELTQSADLSGWKGDRDDPAWQGLLTSLRNFVGRDPVAAAAAPASATAQTSAPRPGTTGAKSRRSGLIAAALALALLAGTAAWLLRPGPDVHTPVNATSPARNNPSVAVLPFANLSTDPEQEPFADGLSEELLDQLARLPGLRVIGRRSSFAFKGRNEDLRTIGQALGVDHILEGSVRKAGDRVRINAQLVNARDGSNVWSQSWERRLDDIFAIQDEIARAVAGQLKVALAGNAGGDPGTRNVAAYDAYLAGKALSYLPTHEDANRQLERAIELDPDFVQPRMQLAYTHLAAIAQDPGGRAVAQRKRKARLEEVVVLAADTPEASLASAYLAADAGRYAESVRQHERYGALAGAGMLQRDFFYGQLLLALGQVSRSIEQLQAARSDDPLSPYTALNLLIGYEITGQYDRAESLSREISALPGIPPGFIEGTSIVRAMGRRDVEALRLTIPEAVRNDPSMGGQINRIMLQHLDDPAMARRELARLIDEPGIRDSTFLLAAVVQWASWFDDRRLAIEALERLARLDVPLVTWGMTLWRPVSANLRGEPAFKRLLRDVGIVDYWRETGNWGDFCQPVGKDDFQCR